MKRTNIKNKILGFLAFFIFVASVAWAHEKRGAGEYELVVGFVSEPAFSGQINGVDLRVSREGELIENLEKTLRAEVQYENEPEFFPLHFRKRYKEPGRYAAYFLPSLPGKYTFHITGKISDTEIDEVFASGEKFHDVEDIAAVIWPKV